MDKNAILALFRTLRRPTKQNTRAFSEISINISADKVRSTSKKSVAPSHLG